LLRKLANLAAQVNPIPQKHYDKAVLNNPNQYSNYSFDQWIGFMKYRMLIASHPSQMVELSFNGKDFLKYLAHVGRDANEKAKLY